jgi:protein-S-isoprenylcysteine O-methyltransferase Ste14
MRAQAKMLELKVPPLVVVAITSAGMWGAAALTPAFSAPFPGRACAAGAVALCGGAVALLGVVAFRRAGTTVNPLQPQQASSVVRQGIYRFSRNPQYLGMLLALAGLAIYLANAAALVFLPAFVLYLNRFQIAPEEQVLTRLYGEAYTTYMRSVRRWI